MSDKNKKKFTSNHLIVDKKAYISGLKALQVFIEEMQESMDSLHGQIPDEHFKDIVDQYQNLMFIFDSFQLAITEERNNSNTVQ